MKNLLSLIVALFYSAIAVAASGPDEAVVQEMARQTNLPAKLIRENYNACDSGHTTEMIMCGRYNWIAEDIRLNRIYKQALAKAREIGYDASLIKTQRAWVAYRDALCKYEGEWYAGGGREEGVYMLSCMNEITRQRADHLETQLKTAGE